jgi:hypothetical protein
MKNGQCLHREHVETSQVLYNMTEICRPIGPVQAVTGQAQFEKSILVVTSHPQIRKLTLGEPCGSTT